MSAGDPKFVLLRYSAWLDVAKYQAQGVNIEDQLLGSIVRQYQDPTGGDYLPNNPLQYNEEVFDEKTFTDFIADSSRSTDNQANVSVTSLMGASLKGAAADKAHLQGKLVRMRRLQKHQQFFDKLKENIEVSRRVPSWMSVLNFQDPVCLVVGIMTCQDVELSNEGSRTMEVNGRVQVPIAEIVSSGAGATMVGAGNVANPQVSVAGRRDAATVFEGRSESKTIFAVEVKEVTTKLLKRKSLLLKQHDLNPGSGKWLGDGDEEEEEYPDVDDLILEEADF